MINLKDLITKYPECLESASKLRSYLVDIYPEEKARIRVIVDSFDCGIYEQMKGADLADKLFISGLCKKLESEYGYSNVLSIWCIEQWVKIFNKDLVISAPIFDTEKECVESKKNADTYKNIKVGDIITLGQYPQGANGEIKPIEWQVLDVDNGSALIISRYALDYKKYDDDFPFVNWDDCSLRKWLNSDFYNEAFGSADNAIIITTNVTADENKYYKDTYQGKDVKDKVFLLSIIQASKYFASGKMICNGTDYYYAKNKSDDGSKNCCWWLRTSGKDTNFASYFIGDCIFERGCYTYAEHAVRPAMRIKISENTIIADEIYPIDDPDMVNSAVSIKTLKLGDEVNIIGEIQDIRERETMTGKPYLIIHIADFSGQTSGVYYLKKKTYTKIKELQVGDTIIARGTLTEYNEMKSFKFNKINKCKLSDELIDKIKRFVANNKDAITEESKCIDDSALPF